MEIPDRLEDWGYDTVVEIVKTHELEPAQFDYKDVLNVPDQEVRESIRRTVCSMANTDGGYILFGIQDRKLNVHSPVDRIRGIPLNGDLLKEFGEKIKVIQPEIPLDEPPKIVRLPHVVGKGIFIVHIPRSPRRPHMVESPDRHIFYRRGQGGSAVQMGYYEVREQMLSTEERLRKVTLLRLMITQYFAQVQKLSEVVSWNISNPNNKRSIYFDTSAYMIILNDAVAFLPTSGDLLNDLLEISVQANILQGIVVAEGPAKAQYNSATLHNLCGKCLQHLTEIFGPLESGGKPSA